MKTLFTIMLLGIFLVPSPMLHAHDEDPPVEESTNPNEVIVQ